VRAIIAQQLVKKREADPKGSVSFQIMGDVIQLKAWTQERNSNNTKWISHNYYLRAWTN